jgi:hypothetical protein
MTRDFRTSQFTDSAFDSEPDTDPRVGLVNLADVMLVFACGLMLALVAYWNLDVSNMHEVIQTDRVAEVQDITELEESLGDGSGFIELGKVYQDPMTGKFYMLQEDIDRSGSLAGTESGDSAGENPEEG